MCKLRDLSDPAKNTLRCSFQDNFLVQMPKYQIKSVFHLLLS